MKKMSSTVRVLETAEEVERARRQAENDRLAAEAARRALRAAVTPRASDDARWTRRTRGGDR